MNSDMSADQAHAVAQALGQQIQQEWMTTVKVLEAIPEDKKGYKPDPKGRSAWELAVHLCKSDVWFLNGVLKKDFTPHDEAAPEAAGYLKNDDITVSVDLGAGGSSSTVWTCDLSAEYVRINAEYRT